MATFLCDVCGKSVRQRQPFFDHFWTHSSARPFQCCSCGTRFAQSIALKRHETYTCTFGIQPASGNMTPAKKPAQCQICQKYSKNILSLRRHMLTHTVKTESYHCDSCDRRFPSTNLIQDHIRMRHLHHNPQCDVCGRAFATALVLFKHFNAAHIERRSTAANATFICDKCDNTYAIAAALQQHTYSCRRRQMGSLKFWTCADCEKSFATKTARKRHRCAPIRQADDWRQCDDCAETTASVWNLAKHIMRAHLIAHHSPSTTTTSTVVCDDCEKTYTIIDNLKAHIGYRHLRKKKRKFPGINPPRRKDITLECDICSYICRRKENLVHHMAILHFPLTDVSEFRCRFCSQKCSNKANLGAHERTHEMLKRFRCFLCVRSYREASKLAAHIQIEHKGIKAKADYQAQCDSCDRIFKQRSLLIKHAVTVHNGMQDFAIFNEEHNAISVKVSNRRPMMLRCSQCLKSFPTIEYLRSHVRHQHGKASFLCQTCGKSFTRKSQLAKHERMRMTIIIPSASLVACVQEAALVCRR